MDLVLTLLRLVLWLYLLVLLGRVVIDWIQVFARDWRPRGAVLVLCELIFTLTDPPLKLLRRFIPPLRLGRVQIDLSFIVLFLACSLLMNVLAMIQFTMRAA
ncbi:YggT family protein [Flavimobilis sp. GY10621]|uniref:YggT family protein n=1 Tax=Flavimobilis rhizosphaerae TaxID=2775421 RepID=A0ABR9DUM2_9MICO|nr:YggT family protein [Flavimobilis rhizosphaerae]MBD9699715.1 YggT family protein [Flavimobilis rhizosphaerae]